MLLCTSSSCDQKVRVPIQITLFLVYLESKIIFNHPWHIYFNLLIRLSNESRMRSVNSENWGLKARLWLPPLSVRASCHSCAYLLPAFQLRCWFWVQAANPDIPIPGNKEFPLNHLMSLTCLPLELVASVRSPQSMSQAQYLWTSKSMRSSLLFPSAL